MQITRKLEQQVQRPCGRRCFQDLRRREEASTAWGVLCPVSAELLLLYKHKSLITGVGPSSGWRRWEALLGVIDIHFQFSFFVPWGSDATSLPLFSRGLGQQPFLYEVKVPGRNVLRVLASQSIIVSPF